MRADDVICKKKLLFLSNADYVQLSMQKSSNAVNYILSSWGWDLMAKYESATNPINIPTSELL